jgi:protein-disulfide isomerase
LSTRNDTPPPATRRERRAAERARGVSTAGSPGATTGRRGSPILWITAIVAVVAVVFIGAMFVLQGTGPGKADVVGLVPPKSPTPTALADGRTLGKADAVVTLDVWSDYQCPACAQFAEIVEPALIRDHVTPGTLRIVHHDAAFQGARVGGPYDESVEPAAGARCAAAQGKYWPFHDWLFANQAGENKGAYADARLRGIATYAGLDVNKWDACRKTGDEQAAVRTETSQGTASGVNATPTLYLNGEKIVGLRSAADLGKMIEAAAAAGK